VVFRVESEIIGKLEEIEEWFSINQASNKFVFVLAFLIFMAFLVVMLAKRYRIPIVVGYVFLGILLSHDIVDKIPFLSAHQKGWYFFILNDLEYITNIALSFIAFTIGSELSIRLLRRLKKSILFIALLESSGAFLFVTLATMAIGRPIYLALLLGAIASATAPAATVMVLKEYRAEGVLTSMIMAVVSIDDAIALIIFSLIEPVAFIQYSGEGNLAFLAVMVEPLKEIFGAVLIGLVIGYLSQLLISRFEDDTKKILLLVTTVIGASAIAIYLDFSPLITNMLVGFAYRNYARKNLGIVNYLDTLTTPLYAMFFILAGTEIRFSSIFSAAFLVTAFVYLLARITGKVAGATMGAVLGQAPGVVKKYIGFGLLPQSGVAIALAYTVEKTFSSAPHIGLLVFNTLLFTAALTEVLGPFFTKYAVIKAGEADQSTYQQSS
jgi:Kef-type K+ transport system membrane component KefB